MGLSQDPPIVREMPECISSSRSHLVLLAALSIALAGCKPEFKSDGSITVDGEPFVPVACHVLACPTGVALVDADGARMELGMKGSKPDAFESVSGNPSVTYAEGPGAAITTVEKCGSLTLTGEGYHGEGKRAVSGVASLSCEGGVSVSGDMKFEGCF